LAALKAASTAAPMVALRAGQAAGVTWATAALAAEERAVAVRGVSTAASTAESRVG